MFRHPTLREGFSAFMASSPNWLEIFISGLDDDGILTQLDCGSGDTRGTLVAIPPTLYRAVAERVAKARDLPRPSSWENRWERYGRWSAFLANRCSADFLKLYLEVDQQALGGIVLAAQADNALGGAEPVECVVREQLADQVLARRADRGGLLPAPGRGPHVEGDLLLGYVESGIVSSVRGSFSGCS